MEPSSYTSTVSSRASPRKEENKGNDCFCRMLCNKRLWNSSWFKRIFENFWITFKWRGTIPDKLVKTPYLLVFICRCDLISPYCWQSLMFRIQVERNVIEFHHFEVLQSCYSLAFLLGRLSLTKSFLFRTSLWAKSLWAGLKSLRILNVVRLLTKISTRFALSKQKDVYSMFTLYFNM